MINSTGGSACDQDYTGLVALLRPEITADQWRFLAATGLPDLYMCHFYMEILKFYTPAHSALGLEGIINHF